MEAEATLLLTVLPHTYTVLLSNSTTDTTHTRLLPSPWEIFYAPLQEIFGNRLLPPYTFEHSLPTLSWWTSNISQSLMQWNANKARPYQLHGLPHQLLYRTPSPWGFLYISGTWGCSFSRSSICMKTNLPTSVRGHITAQPPLGMENKAPRGACRIIRITLWVRTSSWRCGYTIGNPILHHTILICKNLPPRHRLHSCFCNPALLSTLPLLCPLPLATPHLPLWLPTRSLTSVYPVLVNLTFS